MNGILDAFRWAKSLRKYKNGDYGEAINSANKIFNKERIGGRYYAYLGTVYILNHDSLGSKDKFENGIRISSCRKTFLDNYIISYCNQYLYIIEHGKSDKNIQEILEDMSRKMEIPYYIPVPTFQK